MYCEFKWQLDEMRVQLKSNWSNHGGQMPKTKTNYSFFKQQIEIKQGLVNECPRVTLKHPKFSNYSFKKSTITIFNAFNTQLFIKNFPFKVLKECPGGTR